MRTRSPALAGLRFYGTEYAVMRGSAFQWCLGLALTGLLLAGCQSPSRTASAAHTKPDIQKSVPIEQWDLTLNDTEEKRVEAFSRFAAGVSLEIQEQSDDALEEFFRAGLADPANERLVMDVARRLIQGHQLEKASILLGKSSEVSGASANLLTLLGLVYAEQNRYDEAIAANQKAIQKDPSVLAPYRGLVQVYLKQDNTAGALNALDAATRADKVPASYTLELAELYAYFIRQKPNDSELAKMRMKEALDTVYAGKPDTVNVLQKLADGYLFLKDITKTTEIYLDMLERFPNTPGIRERLTSLYIQSGDKANAIKLLETLVKENPTRSPEAYYLLARLLRDEKKYGEAADQLERMLIVKEDAEPAYYELAEIHNLNNQPELALAVLDKAKVKFGESFVNRFYRAVTFNRLKKYDKAVEQLTAAEVIARATSPERLNENFYFQLGSTYERNKDYPQAVKYFEKCLQMDPDFAEALNYLGYMWAERGENLDRAKAMIEKAVKQEPDNAAFLDSMAWVLYKQNKPQPALEWMQKAMKHVEEEDPTLYDHLGDIYSSLKDYSKAREAWQKSIKIEPNDEVKKKLESAPR